MAQVYSAQAYNRIPQAPPAGPSSRRHPFTNAVNHQNMNQQAAPSKPQEKAKQPASPPLPRQNAKITPPSPPKVISDKSGRFQLSRVGFLGEGGFARVYEVKDPRGARLACKVVTKESLKTKKAKTKLYAEIKIHRSLEHPNIVGFQECFEDNENVYMTLELCPSGSLMDMLRRRRRFTEPEARFFMVQLIGACHYMHTHQVIHRDLKLGNLFLDANMNVKVGDFGLAALIENPGERKKTICGTPNYIAPEVLFDTANGHSFEVDTWSIGVILYTLVIGRPPFQTSEVKAIYKRIRDNDYAFPSDRSISSNAQHLISQILTPDPQMRPILHDIVDHPFFTDGIVPAYIPTSAHDAPPDFRRISRAASQSNLRRLRRYSLLDEDQITSIAVPKAPESAPAPSLGKSMTSSIAQQEKEFQKAVQPGSPISALLSSARQPLLMSNNNGGRDARESPLLRKLQAVKESPLGRRPPVMRGLNGIVEEDGTEAPLRGREEHQEEELKARKKELEAQKARIVAQMAPVREEEDEYMLEKEEKEKEKEPVIKERVRVRTTGDRENVPPPPPTRAPVLAPSIAKGKEKEREKERDREREKDPRVVGRERTALPLATSTASLAPPPRAKLSGFDAAAHVLSLAFDAKAAGKLFRDPREDAHLPLPNERVFIVSWVDYCNKYGMGYALTDGSVGVHFNDSTSLVLSADKQHFDYITSRRQGTVYVRKSHTVDEYPEELKSKVYLLKHFERYIMDRLYGEYDYTYEDVNRSKGMEWVQKYLRMKHVIVFKLSHDVLQFNFYDHSKVILSSHGLMITHIDKNYKMTQWTLSDVMALALKPTSALSGVDPDLLKSNQRLVDKLKYCMEVLVSIKTASTAGLAVPEENDAMGAGLATAPGANVGSGISSRGSKASLR
ncbi:kinase-like domain-containing protein [Collybia nuda]|uniref:Serine/threonine-protein kinase n=1 Tax=Collybia nuda TaxID=64659 RepID=A0A9P5YE76_9AGAR|nr:kinase-like domain-containing protein [Collybia nuda]